MSVRPQRRLRAGRILFALFVAMIVANESVTRGYVTSGDGQPIVGADVWFAESTHVIYRLRTDATGYFAVVHAPFARYGYQMLVCAGQQRMFVEDAPTSAIFHTGYGIDADTSRFPDVPADRGWAANVPASCPSRTNAPAG